MERGHIAFISYPQYPHVGPTIPLVAVLARRGYRISYVTSERFLERVTAAGATAIRCPEVVAYVPSSDQADACADGDGGATLLATETLRTVVQLYESDRPNLIIYDYGALAGRILSNKLNIPAIKASPTFAHDERNHARQVPNPELRRILHDNGGRFARYLRRHGVTSPQDWVFHKERLNIHFCPRIFQPHESPFDQDRFYAGRCPGEQPYYGDWSGDGIGSRPIALVSTSTLYCQGPEYFKLWIRAFSDLEWHVILSIGDGGDPTAFKALPPHFEIVKHTSHVKILPRASLLVGLGGIISSAEAAYHGVPLLVTSLGQPELEWQADNLERLGIAIHLKKDEMDGDSLKNAIKRSSSDAGLRERVARMRRVIAREPGAEEAANVVEDYLNRNVDIAGCGPIR